MRRPFTEPLPPWDAREAELPPPWIEAFQALAGRLGMTLEDPDALHRPQPSLEVPGRAVCVMRGRLDGVEGRLVYTAERLVRRAQVVGGAVRLPPADGASTPLGGLRGEAPLGAEVRDGVLACWSRRTADRSFGEVDQLVAASLRAARRYGLAAVTPA